MSSEKTNSLLEENKLLKLPRFSFENFYEKSKQFRSATGINPDFFMGFFNYLNPGYDSSNIKFYDTSKRLSEEKYANSEEVRSGPKLKNSAKEQLFMHLSWLKSRFTLSHASFFVSNPKSHSFKIYYYLNKFLDKVFALAQYLFGLVNKSTKKCLNI